MSRLNEVENPLEEARLLMPWYVTGKLADDEKAFVEVMLAEHPELGAALQQEKELVGLVRDNTQLLEITALDSTQQRLDKMLSRIEREEVPAKQRAEQKQASSQADSVKGASWLSGLFKQPLFDMNWLTPANAVFASLLAVQLGVAAFFMQGETSETIYESATAEETSAETSVNAVHLVDFDRDALHGDVIDFLSQWNARVISGPDANNMFVIEVTEADNAQMMQAIDAQGTPVKFIGSKFRAN